MIKYYLLIVLSVILSVISNFFFKKGAILSNENGVFSMINSYLFYGLILTTFTFITYYLSLNKLSINIVYPTISASSLILITIMGFYVFKEPMTLKHIIAICIIFFGIILMYS